MAKYGTNTTQIFTKRGVKLVLGWIICRIYRRLRINTFLLMCLSVITVYCTYLSITVQVIATYVIITIVYWNVVYPRLGIDSSIVPISFIFI